MSRSTQHRHRCNLIPPYVFEQVANNGNDTQRRRATSTSLTDNSFRLVRATSALEPPAPSILGVGQTERTIYDAHNTQTLPGDQVRGEGDTDLGKDAEDEAYDGLGATYDLLFDEFGRDSLDDAGLDLDATVHFGKDYDNAFWDGSQMVFGDGDGDLFNRFTISVDVIGHELFHGVTQYGPALRYYAQPGALNESISDVGGSMVKQYVNNEKAEDADWLIGEGLLADGVDGVALRSMAAPGTAYDDPVLGKDPQPANMRDYVRTSADSGGVHINSGIPNHAFYLIATELGGYTWEAAGLIWYTAMFSPRMTSSTNFRTFASITLGTARRLFGGDSDEFHAVRDGWAGVGIEIGSGAHARTGRQLISGPGEQVSETHTPWAATGRRSRSSSGSSSGSSRRGTAMKATKSTKATKKTAKTTKKSTATATKRSTKKATRKKATRRTT